jgi:hypothetical protein
MSNNTRQMSVTLEVRVVYTEYHKIIVDLPYVPNIAELNDAELDKIYKNDRKLAAHRAEGIFLECGVSEIVSSELWDGQDWDKSIIDASDYNYL